MARLIMVVEIHGLDPAREDPQAVAESLLSEAEVELREMVWNRGGDHDEGRFSLSRAEWADGVETLEELVHDEEDE